MEKRKPVIVVPIGDPAGVGPEIVAKACAQEKVCEAADVIVVGDRQVMEKAIGIVGADLQIKVVEKPADGDYRQGILNLIDLDNIDQSKFSYGVVQVSSSPWQARRTRLPRLQSTRKPCMRQRCPLSVIRRSSAP